MTTLQIYLAKLFFTRWLFIAAGIVSTILILDVISNGDELLETGNTQISDLGRYMFLRSPIIFVKIFSFTVLLAAVFTLASLSARKELVAMMSAGVSQLNLGIGLAPACLLIGAIHFLVDDQLSTRAVSELKTWGVGDYSPEKRKKARPESTWFQQGGNVIRVGAIHQKDLLLDVQIFERDKDGDLIRVLNANQARFEDGLWKLEGVAGTDVDNLEAGRETATYQDAVFWEGNFGPALVAVLAAEPQELTLAELTRFVERTGLGTRPSYVYETWRQRKFAQPVLVIVIALLSIPLAQRFQRHGGGLLLLFGGIGAGFGLFVLDGFLTSLGEAGLLPPLVSAWGAVVFFMLVGLTMAAHREVL